MTIAVVAGGLAVACGSTDRTFVPDDQFYGTAGGAAGDSSTGGGDGGGQAGAGAAGKSTAGGAGTSGASGVAGAGGAGAQGGFSGHPTAGGASGAAGAAGASGTSGNGGASGSGGGAGASGAGGSSGAGGAGAAGIGGSGGMSGSGGAGGDACGGCVMPPAAACQLDGATLRTFVSPGTCAGGSCSYSFSDATCPFGCAAGACVQNPCTGTTCSTPPTPVCNGSSVRAYLPNGTCNGSGMCTYPFTDTPCAMGCSNGTCVTDPCAGVLCNAIPATTCTTPTTLRTYSGPGMCLLGACSYPSMDTACPGGCTGTTCTQCSAQAPCGGTQWCNAGTCASCASACGNGLCDCGETSATCAGDCGAPCPTAKVIGDWASSDDGWTLDAPWSRVFGYMTFGSSQNAYNKPYTLNVTYGSDVALQGCATATLSFNVRLGDDINYSPKTDKSERLTVQCSGDSGMSWISLTPGPMPSIESSCGTSYCSGSSSVDRSFPWTGQSAAIPAACLKATARFRFSATGKTAWALQSPGWSVDAVTIN